MRLKRESQAEFLAKFVQERQKANPNENIVLLGDFNAFQFNDGIGDIIGVIKGMPAPKDQVLFASDDFVNPDLIDLVDFIKPEQQYSYSFDGNAQVLDHVIINQAMKKYLAGFGYGRLNADFPEVYRNDNTRVERYSDHDPAIAYFNFDEKSPTEANTNSAPQKSESKDNSPFQERYIGGNTPPEIEIKNESSQTLYLKFAGIQYVILPSEIKKISVEEGNYLFEATAPDVESLSGEKLFKRGYIYNWNFFIRTTIIRP